MQRISVNLINDCGGNQLLTMTMTYLQLETRTMHYKNLLKQIFRHSNRQRETATFTYRLLSGPRYPILHSNIFFYVKLLSLENELFY